MQNPNHQVTWQPTRPELTIRYLRGTSRNCYHQSWFEIISRRELDAADLARLDACGMLGIGQSYNLESTEKIIETCPPVTIDKRTGQHAKNDDGSDVPPIMNGLPFTATHDYPFYRYIVRRICDSGD